ncbi:MAG: hypothetical protein GOV01_03580 [Candidatus Altiarchaeota archaeon]|nr:hypothetical protein [Candidatus Altiarchaeota archaeon]
MDALVLDMFGGILDEGHVIKKGFLPQFKRNTSEYAEIKLVYHDLCVGKATELDFSNILKKFGVNYEDALAQCIQMCVNSFDKDFFEFSEPIYIYTHFYSKARDILDALGVSNKIKRCFITSEMKTKKPEGMVFVAKELSKKYDLSRVVIVDDGLANLAAAKKAGFGITALKVLETRTVADFEGVDLVIKRLSDLKDLKFNKKSV